MAQCILFQNLGVYFLHGHENVGNPSTKPGLGGVMDSSDNGVDSVLRDLKCSRSHSPTVLYRYGVLYCCCSVGGCPGLGLVSPGHAYLVIDLKFLPLLFFEVKNVLKCEQE